jgi:hypothetical protein
MQRYSEQRRVFGLLVGSFFLGMAAMMVIVIAASGWSLATATSRFLPQAPGRFETFIGTTVADGITIGCDGGLTHNIGVSEYLGAKYLPIHNYCGGFPILDLRIGDSVIIAEVGEFAVVDFRSVPFGNIPATSLRGLAGEVILQTSYRDNSAMRAVGLNRSLSG